MAKEKYQFYLVLNATMVNDPERFQKSMTKCYVMGIEPLEYHETTIDDTEHQDENGNDKVVANVILLKCQERWKGAAKRFFRKCNFEYLNHIIYDLPMYG